MSLGYDSLIISGKFRKNNSTSISTTGKKDSGYIRIVNNSQTKTFIFHVREIRETYDFLNIKRVDQTDNREFDLPFHPRDDRTFGNEKSSIPGSLVNVYRAYHLTLIRIQEQPTDPLQSTTTTDISSSPEIDEPSMTDKIFSLGNKFLIVAGIIGIGLTGILKK